MSNLLAALKRHKVLSSMAVIFLCTVIGGSLAILLSVVIPYFIYDHHRLPSPPVRAEKIIGVELGGFYEARLAVQAIDGQIYIYPITGGGESWEVGTLSEDTFDQECRRRNERRLGVIGDIVHCREFQAFGEWCPSSVQSIAIDSKGELWELESLTPCPLLIIPFAVLLGAIGFIVGIILVAIRRPASILK